MSTLGILDLVIGLFFLYFVFSVICSSCVEILSQLFRWRNRELEKWIEGLFDISKEPEAAQQLLNHALIKGLTKQGRKPDYIPADIFSTALLSTLVETYLIKDMDEPQVYQADFHTIREAIVENSSLAPGLKSYLLQAMFDGQDSSGSLFLVKRRLETWFNHAMDRVGGTYRKWTRTWTFVIALLIAGTGNVDTLALIKYLKEHPEERALLVEYANKQNTDSTLQSVQQRLVRIQQSNYDSIQLDSLISTTQKNIAEIQQQYAVVQDLSERGLPLGWSNTEKGQNWLQKILGIMLTTFALTLGAPFWFDLINKLVNIRSSGRRPIEEGTDSHTKSTPVG